MTAAAIDSPTAILEQALLFLLRKCDGARTEDRVGFSRWDAVWSQQQLERVQQGRGFSNPESAHRILTKYRKQLAAGGITLPPLEAVHECHNNGTTIPLSPSSRPAAVTIGPIASSTQHVRVALSYDPGRVAKIKSLPFAKRTFNGIDKSWTVSIDQLDALLAMFPDAQLTGELVAAADAAKAKAQAAAESAIAAERMLKERVAADLARLDQILAAIERKPFAHQADGIRWMIERRLCVLADDMGLGKTYQALVAARAIGEHTIVVAPAGLRDNWFREAAAVRHRIEVHSWAKVPPAPKGKKYTLIVDEAHYGQNIKSSRTQQMIDLAAGAECVILMSGTPIKNGRPANLFPLLVAIRHKLAKDRKHFEKHYCNAGPTKWTRWDVTGAAHLEELHAEVADSLLRRMKEDVLDLPAKMRVKRDVELSTEARTAYDTAFNEARAKYRARVDAGQVTNEAEALVMLGIVLQATSLGKVEASVELAEEILENGGQVVLFSRFLPTVRALEAKLHEWGVETITGDISDSTQRQAAVDRFQSGISKVMVLTMAGGVGITLTASQTNILVDRPWTPGDALQIEDRVYRIGQTGTVTCIWPRYGDVDLWLDDEVLEGKQQRANVVLTGDVGESLIAQKPTVRSAAQMVKELFA